ncbi:MAG: hypothetical protein ACYDGM_11420 [Vulcanimicrobiaceae bacterium]
MNRKNFAAAAALWAVVAFCAPYALAGPSARAHGAVSGRVESVDYGQGTIIVRRGQERTAIAVVPSTQIYLHDAGGTFADVHPGAQVDIIVSEIGGHLVAQIIRVK